MFASIWNFAFTKINNKSKTMLDSHRYIVKSTLLKRLYFMNVNNFFSNIMLFSLDYASDGVTGNHFY